MTTTLNVFGLTLTIASIVCTAAVVQWLVIAGISALSRERIPNQGMRGSEKRLALSTAILGIVWIAVFSGATFTSKTTQASVTGGAITRGSCASVSTEMTAAAVKRKIGNPDEIRPDEETRGPGAVIWIYRNSRCAVHLFDEKVEFVD